MKITELVQEIKDKKIQNTKIAPTAVEDYIKGRLVIKSYIPFVDKRELCTSVLNASCKQVGAVVESDSVSRYLLFTITIISKYTNLEFGNDVTSDPIDDYDVLCESGLLNPILEAIGGEYTVCNNLLNMMMADITANNNNTAAVLDKSAQKLLSIVDDFAHVLSDKVENWDLDLSQIDIDKYAGLLEKLKG